MKKSLILICMFTSLASAQDVTKNQSKENRLLSQFDENQLVVRNMDGCSCSPYAFPDSVYIYYGKEEKPGKTAAIKYDGACRKLQEKGLTDLNGDGITEENEWYLKEYTYTSKKNSFEIESLFTCLLNDIWETVSKEIYVYSSSDEFSSYYFRGGEWKLEQKQKRTDAEYDGENRPVVYMDSIFKEKTNGYDTLTVRVEISYNENGWCDLSTSFRPTGSTVTGEEWIPTYKTESTYGTFGLLTKEVHYSYDLYYNDGNSVMKWARQSTVEYAYDEKGSITAETVIDKDGIVHNRARYVNFYTSPNANEAIFSVQSAVYPNPVSDVLYVAVEGTDHAVITLLNASGTVVATQNTNQPVTLLPVRSLAKGFYFVTVQTSKGVRTHKVVVN